MCVDHTFLRHEAVGIRSIPVGYDFARRDILFLELRINTFPRLPMYGNLTQLFGRRFIYTFGVVGSCVVLCCVVLCCVIGSGFWRNCLMSVFDSVFGKPFHGINLRVFSISVLGVSGLQHILLTRIVQAQASF